jgi:hypothetical protein
MRRFVRDPAVAGLSALLVVLAAVEAVFVPHETPRFLWHFVPGYAAMIGLGACVVVVLLSKALGRMVLQRPERADD